MSIVSPLLATSAARRDLARPKSDRRALSSLIRDRSWRASPRRDARATGSDTGSTAQATSSAVMGCFLVASQACCMPAATRSASTWRFSCEPSFHLPAPMLPPAPLKWTCTTPVASCRALRASPGKVGVGQAGAIVALRVRGVERDAPRSARRLFQKLIIFSCGSIVPAGNARTSGSFVAVQRTWMHLAVGPEDAAVRGHLLDFAGAEAQVCDGRGVLHGRCHRGRPRD